MNKPISISEAAQKYNLSRSTFDRKCREGLFKKYTLPGSTKIFLDESEIISSFAAKDESKVKTK